MASTTIDDMVESLLLCLDDSGSRKPDRSPKSTVPPHGFDWFGLGGIVVDQSDEDLIRSEHERFCARWEISYPLHSYEIRSCSGNFTWLKGDERRGEFLVELSRLVTHPKLRVHGCVVDRIGHNARFQSTHGDHRWSLCKTAFSVVVERAAKLAHREQRRLRVWVEKSDKKVDRQIRGYYDAMRSEGLPFNPKTSAKYAPLAQSELHETLYELAFKGKTSPLLQLADLALYPICRGGYDPEYKPYQALRVANTLVDCGLEQDEVETLGIKYSSWQLARSRIERQKKSPANAEL